MLLFRIDEAVANGARLRNAMRVHKVLIENNHVTGVEGSFHGMKFEAQAETVVLAAGGIGSPRILQNSGLNSAGGA